MQMPNQNGSKRNGFPGSGLQNGKGGAVVIKEDDNEHLEDPDDSGINKDI